MTYPIHPGQRSLVDVVNQECGYRQVAVERGDTARWSQKGGLVVEHNWRGREDVCRDGYVVARNQPLRGSVPVPPPFPIYPTPYYPSYPSQHPHGNQPYPHHNDHGNHGHQPYPRQDNHNNHGRPGIVIRF